MIVRKDVGETLIGKSEENIRKQTDTRGGETDFEGGVGELEGKWRRQ